MREWRLLERGLLQEFVFILTLNRNMYITQLVTAGSMQQITRRSRYCPIRTDRY